MFVLDFERCAETFRQRMIGDADIHAKPAIWRVGEKIGAQKCVMLGLDGAALAEAFHALGAAAAGAV